MYQLKLFRKKGVGWDTMSEWVGMFREHIRSYAQPTVTETLSELWSDIIDCFGEEGIN